MTKFARATRNGWRWLASKAHVATHMVFCNSYYCLCRGRNMGGGTKKEKAPSQFFESGLAKEVDSSVSRWIGNSFAIIVIAAIFKCIAFSGVGYESFEGPHLP